VRDENLLVVALRESNTVTSTFYRPGVEDFLHRRCLRDAVFSLRTRVRNVRKASFDYIKRADRPVALP
jgi:hypothetical protein